MRLAAWLVTLPVAAAGALAAHAAAYGIAEPERHAGHAYLGLVEPLVGAALAAGLGIAVLAARRGALGRPPLRLFALLPPAAFLVQETLERGGPPVELVVLAGLALQLPFGLLAAALAALLLRGAEHAGHLLRPAPAPSQRRRVVLPPPVSASPPPAAFVLATAQRGPPPRRRP